VKEHAVTFLSTLSRAAEPQAREVRVQCRGGAAARHCRAEAASGAHMRRWAGSDRHACARETARKSSALAASAPGPLTAALSGWRRSASALHAGGRREGRVRV